MPPQCYRRRIISRARVATSYALAYGMLLIGGYALTLALQDRIPAAVVSAGSFIFSTSAVTLVVYRRYRVNRVELDEHFLTYFDWLWGRPIHIPLNEVVGIQTVIRPNGDGKWIVITKSQTLTVPGAITDLTQTLRLLQLKADPSVGPYDGVYFAGREHESGPFMTFWVVALPVGLALAAFHSTPGDRLPIIGAGLLIWLLSLLLSITYLNTRVEVKQGVYRRYNMLNQVENMRPIPQSHWLNRGSVEASDYARKVTYYLLREEFPD